MSRLASLLKAGWFPGLVFASHCVLSLGFHAYDRFVWLDVVMHLLGGIAIAYFFDAALSELDARGVLSVGSRHSALVMVFGLVAVAAVVWEFAEFAADSLFAAGAQRSLANTMKDQFMGLTGGLVYVGYFYRKATDRMPRPLRLILAAAAAFLCLTLVSAAALAVAGRSHVYRGPMLEPAVWDPTVPASRIVEEARKLTGIWYDPAQGYLNDIGGRLGMIVCMDVPRLAYRNAGTSLKRLLEDDYRAHPGHYGKRDGRPGDPYFDRRARNLYSYCKNNGCLHVNGPPRPGDVVFMSHGEKGWISHIALVTSVEADGGYKVVEASRDDWYVTREHDGSRMLARGWTFRGFGRPLGVRAEASRRYQR